MRSYTRNSPQAAARIVALALIADEHLGKAELDVLDRLNAPSRLGLAPSELHDIVHALCEDLLLTAHLSWADACRIDPRTLSTLLAEVDDPALRLTVLQLCVAVVEADAHVSDGESIVLVAAVEQWGLQHAMFEAATAPLPH